MSAALDDSTLTSLDSLAAEPLGFPVGELLYDNNLMPVDGEETADPITVGKEVAKDTVYSEILRETIVLAQGSTPTLRTLVYLREVSHHRDRWDFAVTVEVADACGSATFGSEPMVVKDEWGTDQSQMAVLDVPLTKITADAGEITVIEVKLYAYWCKSGWISGKNYGCLKGDAIGNIEVEIA